MKEKSKLKINMNKKTELFYNQLIYVNDINYIKNQVLRNITQEEINNRTILDYGCGAGCFSFFILKYSPKKIIGVDIGKDNISYAKKKLMDISSDKIEFICDDLENYDIENNKYDLIWSDTVIELLSMELEKIIIGFKKGLKVNGKLYISFLKYNIKNRIIFRIVKLLSDAVPAYFQSFFYYLIIPIYYIGTLFKKNTKINHEQIRNKTKYLFMPQAKLIKTDNIQNILIKNGFEIIYTRERIKSDLNSPDHIEIKAINIS
jgi:2-polyprenyl-3-methyl-5-hydroxy-6-metoxy-1,4-benzoquinol methylase